MTLKSLISSCRLASIGKQLAFSALGVCVFTALVLAVVHFSGYQIALQARSDIADNQIAGVDNPVEDPAARKQLADLRAKLADVTHKLTELVDLKNKFAELATPTPIKKVLDNPDGKGGPLLEIQRPLEPAESLQDDLEQTLDWSVSVEQSIEVVEQRWRSQYDLLRSLPTGAPMQGALGLNSNFGDRVDPITGSMSRHEGIDFVAKRGTSVYATGSGTVTMAGWDGAYGYSVEILHAEGYVSKYAHASALMVSIGQPVRRGQKIAEVGATGRATGAHLHYEILRNGRRINPMQVMVLPGPKFANASK